MRASSSPLAALGLAALASFAEAQGHFLVNELSFGYTGRINDKGQSTVPGFSILGQPNVPEVLSNKVILTPPSPGNSRGALWSDTNNGYTQWTADVDFRVNGPERGSGNLNIWLARRGAAEVGQNSIYTAGKFEGLALVIDQHGGQGGMIRGFLNDGSVDFKSHHSVDSLAFGHCNAAYRNLGRPSQLKLRQSRDTFKVEIDGRLCFESDKISIPSGYVFGLTAASSDNPDSFEIFKMVVMVESLTDKSESAGTPQQDDSQRILSYGKAGGDSGSGPAQGGARDPNSAFDDDLLDSNAESITSSKAQFTDLHNRLQSVNHHLSTIFRTVANQNSVGETRHAETSQLLAELRQAMHKLDRVEALHSTVQSLEREVQSLRSEVGSKVAGAETNLKRFLSDNHGSMLEHVASKSVPRHGMLIFVIVGSQVLLIGAYIWYERKKTMPKKYL